MRQVMAWVAAVVMAAGVVVIFLIACIPVS